MLLFGEGAEVLPGELHSCTTAALLVCQQKAALGFFCILGTITQILTLLSDQTESKFLMVWVWDWLFLVLLKVLSVSLWGQEHSAL